MELSQFSPNRIVKTLVNVKDDDDENKNNDDDDSGNESDDDKAQWTKDNGKFRNQNLFNNQNTRPCQDVLELYQEQKVERYGIETGQNSEEPTSHEQISLLHLILYTIFHLKLSTKYLSKPNSYYAIYAISICLKLK